MHLYEINEEIRRLTDRIEFDEDTGEVLCDIDAVCAEIDALQMEKKSILEYLAKVVLNLRAESAALKSEEARLRERRTKLTMREDSLMKVLDRECGGKKTDLGVAGVSYRATSHVEVEDTDRAIRWLAEHNHKDCIRTYAPEIEKAAVKKIIGEGEKVPGCTLVKGISCSLK